MEMTKLESAIECIEFGLHAAKVGEPKELEYVIWLLSHAVQRIVESLQEVDNENQDV